MEPAAPAATGRAAWRDWLWVVIFEADTPAGKAFDLGLLIAIVASVVAVMLESVIPIRESHGGWLRGVEWVFTGLFSVEYVLRLVCVPRPARYARSFFGVVDLLAVAPTYLSLLLPGLQSLLVIRALRLLRIFRVLKLGRFLGQANVLLSALSASRDKVIIFLGTVVILQLILGSVMYLIEGEQHGFTSIPRSVYWAIVTMTTVGYGDIAPQTVAGQLVASVVMILGYSILAVPTGIVSAEMFRASRAPVTTRACPACLRHGHDPDARFCKHCGAEIPET